MPKNKDITTPEKGAIEAFGSGWTFRKGTYGFCRSIALNYRRYRHILIVVDSTTLYVEAFPTKSTTAEEVAEILYKDGECDYTGWEAVEWCGGTG